jgi:hypothetical protein
MNTDGMMAIRVRLEMALKLLRSAHEVALACAERDRAPPLVIALEMLIEDVRTTLSLLTLERGDQARD